MREDAKRSGIRTRWAAIGAAVAVTVAGGGLFTAWADSPQSVFTAIAPVRVLDTRDDIGLTGAFTEGQTRFLDVTGPIAIVLPGNVAGTGNPVPDGATAIVANVTAVGPTTAGFVSVRPGTATGTPTTSNLNFAPGTVVPNSVTVELPTTGTRTGQLNLFFRGTTGTATTDLLIDIVGYYTAGTGTPGPRGPAGPAGLTYVDEYDFSASTPIGTADPPGEPAGYTATLNLTIGRYLVMGDVTVRNQDATNAGLAGCRTYVGGLAQSTIQLGSVPVDNPSGTAFVTMAYSDSFTVGVDGSATVSHRCFKLGSSTNMAYWWGNMTIFKVG